MHIMFPDLFSGWVYIYLYIYDEDLVKICKIYTFQPYGNMIYGNAKNRELKF